MPPPETYLAKIEADLRGGKATALTYRSSLEALLEALAPGVEASSDPKHVACGAPDFIVERGRVWINATQYFGGVPEAVWQFRIGGYQVCDKWLKDRRGRALSHDELWHYQRIVAALDGTLRLMAEIDALIPGWPIV